MSSVSITIDNEESIPMEEVVPANFDELIEKFRKNTFTFLDTRVLFSPRLRQQYHDRSTELLEMIYDLRPAFEPKKHKGVLKRFKKLLDHGPKYNLPEIRLLRMPDMFLELMSIILLDNHDLKKMARESERITMTFKAISEQIRKIHESLCTHLREISGERLSLKLIIIHMKFAGCLVFVLDFLVGSTEPFTMKPKESRISCEVQNVSISDTLETVPEILANEPDSLATEPDMLVDIISFILIPAFFLAVLIFVQYLLSTISIM